MNSYISTCSAGCGEMISVEPGEPRLCPTCRAHREKQRAEPAPEPDGAE